MSERWRWRYTGGEGPREGASDAPAGSVDFPTQADAEAWFAGEWEELAAQGVTAVTLLHEDAEVYGPMSLDPA